MNRGYNTRNSRLPLMLLEIVQKDPTDDADQIKNILQLAPPTHGVLQQCLWSAFRKGKTNSAKVLIEHGGDVTYANSYGRTMLMSNSYGEEFSDAKRLEMAKLLVHHGADLYATDKDDKTALHYAVQFERRNVVVWLARFYEEYTISDTLLVAVEYGNLSMARQLLTCGADVNYHADNWIRPIIIATTRQYCDIIAFLIHNGADINSAVGTGAAPIHFASRLSIVVLTAVLQKGANVHAKTNKGNTALHYAIDAGLYDNIKLLLENGSDPNVRNEEGETPLLLACRKKPNIDIIRALLVHGADPNKDDECKSYPLNRLVMQTTFCNFYGIDLLRSYGARINQSEGAHPLALLCSRDVTVPYDLIVGLILRGAKFKASGWFDYVTYQPTVVKLAVWSLMHKRAAVAYFFTFLYGEEKGVRPVPVPRRLTGAAGLYPIRRRLAEYMVHRKASVRYMIEELVSQF